MITAEPCIDRLKNVKYDVNYYSTGIFADPSLEKKLQEFLQECETALEKQVNEHKATDKLALPEAAPAASKRQKVLEKPAVPTVLDDNIARLTGRQAAVAGVAAVVGYQKQMLEYQGELS